MTSRSNPRPVWRPLPLCALLAVLVHPGLRAQEPDPGGPAQRVAPLVTVGSDLEDRLRTSQLLGVAPTAGFLLRSASTLNPPLAPEPGPAWSVVAPELTTVWNSDIPHALNQGSLRAGRGASARLRFGARTAWGPVSLLLAPELVHAANGDFERHLSMRPGPDPYALDWQEGPHAIDLPLRPREGSYSRLSPGQSTLSVALGPVALAASTEEQWWGPGIRNAIVMSNNAEGIPHLHLRTTAPVRTPLGLLEGRWMAGALAASERFDSLAAPDPRSLSGLALTLTPGWEPNLSLGAARSVFRRADGAGQALLRFGDVLLRWPRERPEPEDPRDLESRDAEQVLSLFGRWIFPRDGLEVYAEWARHEFPGSLRDFLTEPTHTQGYTLGIQWARPVAGDVALRIQGELTDLEQNPGLRPQPTGSFYASRWIPEGYTHRGQVIGAAIGPGSSSQWLAVDFLGGGWRAGVFGGRTRWQNDAYYTRMSWIPYMGHDVSVFGGLRVGGEWAGVRLGAELESGNRMNYLFQNRSLNWHIGDTAVDVPNRTLRLNVSWAGRAPRPVEPQPTLVPVAPVPRATGSPAAGAPAQTTRPTESAPAGAPAPDAEPEAASAAPRATAGGLLGERVHVVREGDTLFRIARDHEIPLTVLLDANPGVAEESLLPGQVLQVPAAQGPRAEGAVAAPTTHRVARGETLGGIALRYRVTVAEIRALNRLTDDRILVGQTLLIPTPSR